MNELRAVSGAAANRRLLAFHPQDALKATIRRHSFAPCSPTTAFARLGARCGHTPPHSCVRSHPEKRTKVCLPGRKTCRRATSSPLSTTFTHRGLPATSRLGAVRSPRSSKKLEALRAGLSALKVDEDALVLFGTAGAATLMPQARSFFDRLRRTKNAIAPETWLADPYEEAFR